MSMWNDIKTHWDDWGHPLRPNEADVDAFLVHLQGPKRLLLGDTKELLPYATDYADKYTNGVDWFNLPYEKRSFDTIFGDGALMLVGPALLPTMLGYLKPGGKLILRVFLRNTDPIRSVILDERKFQGWPDIYVPVQKIYDREGEWPTTRAYNGAKDVYYLPNLSDLPTPTAISYPYTQFFPVIVWTA